MNDTSNVSFDDFVEANLEKSPPPFADVGAQSRFLTDKYGDLLVNHLFRYENMPELLQFLEKRLDKNITLSELNKSPEKELNLSRKVFAKLKTHRAADFQIHDALKDGPLLIE